MLTQTRKAPVVGRELVCGDCRGVARNAKPSTRVKRKKGKVLHFITECDLCGDKEKTPFMPKKGKPFLCDLCYKETLPPREERQEAQTANPDDGAEVAASTDRKDRPVSDVEAPVTRARRDAPPRPREEYDLFCRRCKTTVKLNFKPERGEGFICRPCYEKEIGLKDQEDRPDTRLIFKMECVSCGKRETVNFVPKSLSEPICTDCFNARKQRR
jgi:CxxC-x17-CxxC domain-containing protein